MEVTKMTVISQASRATENGDYLQPFHQKALIC